VNWERLCRKARNIGLGLLVAVSMAGAGHAQVVDAELETHVFHEPSVESRMTVWTPGLSLTAFPESELSVHAAYTADIVSGASESIKAGPLLSDQPDIVSQASVEDFRHIASGGFSWKRRHTRASATYTYGQENDYRSHALSASVGTDFFQRNTSVDVSYARAFDQVCNLTQPGLTATLRERLDSADGCFSSAPRVTEDKISVDTFQAAWSQAWTPVFLSQLVLTGSIQNGFLGNPYRAVVIGPTGQTAQEHHPENRARGAATLRLRYYLKSPGMALGLSVRGYGDSWDILSQTYQGEVEQYLAKTLRLRIRGRYYAQTGAGFWSDDYTGGEPRFGPRGQYWSGDRELSPLKSVLVGGRLLSTFQGRGDDAVLGIFSTASAGVSLDGVKTFLDDFTWAGRKPDDTIAFILGVEASGTF
jgi:hypothetical protein